MAISHEPQPLLRPALLAATALCVTSCATSRIDWNARVGSYDYDQAVLELGPPDKAAGLSDGSRVADWLTRPSHVYSTLIAQPYYGVGYCGPVYPAFTIDHYAPGTWLRLQFGPDGRLEQWKRYYK